MSLLKKIFSFKKEKTNSDKLEEKNSSPDVNKPEEVKKDNWLTLLSNGLQKTSLKLNNSLKNVLINKKLDEDILLDIEDILIQADFGIETSQDIINKISKFKYDKNISYLEVKKLISNEIEQILINVEKELKIDKSKKPQVILMVGVNGSGKTTTIGKLAAKLSDQGLKVMLAAGDTFRAAAIEQLELWANKINIPIVTSKIGSDAASLAYDAYQQALNNNIDVLLIDTAGRLQNKIDLMEELKKIVKVLKKIDKNVPHDIIQIIDATTGQNALKQVEIFKKTADVNGLIITKLDGTARGGILIEISRKFQLPVYFIGIGEAVEDLQKFCANNFAQAILSANMEDTNEKK
ncbi:signal recognition particle-docking protein FtsY [Bartonella sp. DGB1]|uniref:signal recognition particle-docking protein FtsY n=1 Tax=Bartonella sp. DGB1 TaxID=3239807 RepID=UPI0035255473